MFIGDCLALCEYNNNQLNYVIIGDCHAYNLLEL